MTIWSSVRPCSTNVQPIWGCWDCLWPNMAIYGQKGSFLRGSGAPKCHFLGAKRVQTHPPRWEVQCSTMFNRCSTNLGLLGLLIALLPNIAIFGQKKVIFGGFWAPKSHFLGAKRAQTHPPRCGVQCSTMFNQCSIHLGSLGLPVPQYGHFEPKNAI